ncbi:hypothetical protein O181_026069 [Austropuccinia psidii MF-1]|uniref:NADH dehydrogenase [ubiquinone] 1 alpha subcomplex subunit n=1 Tax=Austropuccinia psidii MF-1 TaxID=1389203 RepID=A0A9Q3H198_9BASI|nr:hypothetical protein [Austropuccinia psidii MF-1]
MAIKIGIGHQSMEIFENLLSIWSTGKLHIGIPAQYKHLGVPTARGEAGCQARSPISAQITQDSGRMSTSLSRSIRNLLKLGPKEYIRILWNNPDPKFGELKGTDQHGNKYFEDINEPLFRTRWVDYQAHDVNASQVPPEWQSWLRHNRQEVPDLDPIMIQSKKQWQVPHVENLTGTRSAFKTYSTTSQKFKAWEPEVLERK